MKMKELWIWLKRFRQRKGYNVHSPFAFSLITSVINERGTYYAYRVLERRHHLPLFSEAYNRRRINRLLFRLSNAVQPRSVLLVGDTSGNAARYLSAGCKKAIVHRADSDEEALRTLRTLPAIGLLYLTQMPANEEFMEDALAKADSSTLFVLEGIHATRMNKIRWHALQTDSRTGISFDLYDVGLIFFDRQRNKQHYTVNYYP